MFLLLLSAEWERTYIETGCPITYYDDPNEEKDFHSVNFWIMKNLRNNLTHFSFSDNISEIDVAFFFIIAMRNFFSLDLNEYPFERILFSLLPANQADTSNFNINEINKQNKKRLLEICKQKKVDKRKVKKEKIKIQESDKYTDIAYAFIDTKNKGDVKKEDLKKYTKIILYHAFLSEMESYLIKTETPLQNENTNSKDKLVAFALEAASKN